MKCLILGRGGREEALKKACQESPSVTEVHIFSKFPRQEPKTHTHPCDVNDKDQVVEVAHKQKVDLVIIGPEKLCVEGYADDLRKEGFKVFAPSKEAAQLEASKVFSKKLMIEEGIPTPRYQVVTSPEEAVMAVENKKPPYVLKADGLASGKGVFICDSLKQVQEKAEQLFVDKIFQEAGEVVLVEEFQRGREVSFLVLTNGEGYELLPLAQDYKKYGESGKGPNTGGMGAMAPIRLPQEAVEDVHERILQPTIRGLQKRGLFYRGVLYVGTIFTDEGCQVLEYNVRFGDPEAQVILPLIEGDVASYLLQVAKGSLPKLSYKDLYSVCVSLVAPGYPFQPKRGQKIEGDIFHKTKNSYFLLGHVAKEKNSWVTDGGRVMNAVAFGLDKRQVVEWAYEQARQVQWEGLHFRSDIGAIECL